MGPRLLRTDGSCPTCTFLPVDRDRSPPGYEVASQGGETITLALATDLRGRSGNAAGSQFGVTKASSIIAAKILSDAGSKLPPPKNSGSVSDIVSGLNFMVAFAALPSPPSPLVEVHRPLSITQAPRSASRHIVSA
ncbi:hypothetical protein FPV67DRAFT_1665253 [Lyophyllum atratum]|nr:hypothetical protein FPV67DRAFT_1665253 [Lyophyllum atratum]